MPVIIDNTEVVESGTIITFNNNPVTFSIENLQIRLIFLDNPSVNGNSIEYQLISGLELNINCINFHHTIGIGNTNPLSLGELRGRRLYLNFRVYSLGPNLDRTIHYSFYLGEGVNHE